MADRTITGGGLNQDLPWTWVDQGDSTFAPRVAATSGGGASGSIITGDTGQNAAVVTGSRKEVTFSTSTVQAVGTTDVSNYTWVSVQINTQGTTSTVTFQGSNDSSTWFAVTLAGAAIVAGGISSSTTATSVLYNGPMPYRYFRLNVTGISGGTTAGVIEFFSEPKSFGILNANGNVAAAVADGSTLAISQNTIDANMLYNGASWDRQRTPNIFKTATASASGDTAVWTPTAGKKFRLMRYMIQFPANSAISGGGVVVDALLRDATTATGAAFSSFIPTTAITTNPGTVSSGWIDLGNGYLSTAINNVLNVNLSTALTTGTVRVMAVGTEE